MRVSYAIQSYMNGVKNITHEVRCVCVCVYLVLIVWVEPRLVQDIIHMVLYSKRSKDPGRFGDANLVFA